MKIIIYTLNAYYNYGNRLQLFALVSVLKRLLGRRAQIRVYWKRSLKSRLGELLKYRTPIALNFKKEAKLRRFTKEYTAKITSRTESDYSIFGSDQIWNPNYYKNRLYLLGNDAKGKKIAYAASMGIDELTDKQKKVFKNVLSSFKNVSVREQSAKKVLQPLVGGDIKVVLDPTLLLGAEEYQKIEKKPRAINKKEKFILCYILGRDNYKEAIEKCGKERGYKVVFFPILHNSKYGIEEFLYLIHHAELICTDSFHACVLSFIFERPFVAFRRTGEADYMYSRLQNLIDTFKLKDREFNGRSITEKNIKVDYTEAKEILKKEQEKSLKFLKDALGVKDEGR